MTDDEKAAALELMAAWSAELAASEYADGWLALAAAQCSRRYFGRDYALALALYALHLGALASRTSGDEAGSLASKAEGGLSVGYSLSSDSDTDPWYSQTTYGLALWNLIRAHRLPLVTGRP